MLFLLKVLLDIWNFSKYFNTIGYEGYLSNDRLIFGSLLSKLFIFVWNYFILPIMFV